MSPAVFVPGQVIARLCSRRFNFPRGRLPARPRRFAVRSAPCHPKQRNERREQRASRDPSEPLSFGQSLSCPGAPIFAPTFPCEYTELPPFPHRFPWVETLQNAVLF